MLKASHPPLTIDLEEEAGHARKPVGGAVRPEAFGGSRCASPEPVPLTGLGQEPSATWHPKLPAGAARAWRRRRRGGRGALPGPGCCVGAGCGLAVVLRPLISFQRWCWWVACADRELRPGCRLQQARPHGAQAASVSVRWISCGSRSGSPCGIRATWWARFRHSLGDGHRGAVVLSRRPGSRYQSLLGLNAERPRPRSRPTPTPTLTPTRTAGSVRLPPPQSSSSDATAAVALGTVTTRN